MFTVLYLLSIQVVVLNTMFYDNINVTIELPVFFHA